MAVEFGLIVFYHSNWWVLKWNSASLERGGSSAPLWLVTWRTMLRKNSDHLFGVPISVSLPEVHGLDTTRDISGSWPSRPLLCLHVLFYDHVAWLAHGVLDWTFPETIHCIQVPWLSMTCNVVSQQIIATIANPYARDNEFNCQWLPTITRVVCWCGTNHAWLAVWWLFNRFLMGRISIYIMGRISIDISPTVHRIHTASCSLGIHSCSTEQLVLVLGSQPLPHQLAIINHDQPMQNYFKPRLAINQTLILCFFMFFFSSFIMVDGWSTNQ